MQPRGVVDVIDEGGQVCGDIVEDFMLGAGDGFGTVAKAGPLDLGKGQEPPRASPGNIGVLLVA